MSAGTDDRDRIFFSEENLAGIRAENMREWLEFVIGIDNKEVDFAGRIYRKLTEVCPDDPDLCFRYGMFFRKQADYDGALPWLMKAVRLNPRFSLAESEVAYTMCKLERYDESEDWFCRAFAQEDIYSFPESTLMFLNFVLCKQCGFDYEKIKNRLIQKADQFPGMKEHGGFDRLSSLAANHVRQIYALDRHFSGFILFADLVGSTQYKREFPRLWPARILHFLMFSRLAFHFFGFDFIKFIGDEVMVFYPFNEMESKAQIALKIHNLFFDRQDWYLGELNRFNPALAHCPPDQENQHEIKVKIFVGEVRDALVFSPTADEHYDLIGADVDRAARLKEMASENLVVVDDAFRAALAQNGPAFAGVFDDMRWKKDFKGIRGKTGFYGKFMQE